MGTVVLVVCAALAAGVAPAAAQQGRPPDLERFVARFNPSTTTTFYIATASDPDGGRLAYQWTLNAECGLLIEPTATGPSNGYQFGPPARRPEGCPREEQSRATISVKIVDSDGCAIVYSQRARDETEHVRPPVRTEPCPPGRAAAEGGSGFPAGLVVAAIIIAAGAWAFTKMRPRLPQQQRAPRRAPAAEPAPASKPPEAVEAPPWTAAPAPAPAVVDAVDAPLSSLVPVEPPCVEGDVRGEAGGMVAHDTVLAGAVRASAGDRSIEIPAHDAREILRLSADIPPDKPLEVEVEVPLRLVTVVASRREVCRQGRWVPDAQSTTHDGPERTERLRAIATGPEDLARFADEVLGRRLRTLAEARRRLEAALSAGTPPE